MRVRSLGQEDLLEEEMATHSSILAWRIPWTEETNGIIILRYFQNPEIFYFYLPLFQQNGFEAGIL